MFWLLLILISIVLALILIHRKIVKPYDYWNKRNITCFLTHGPYQFLLSLLTFNINILDLINLNYFALPDKKYYGIINFRLPCIILRDPDLITQIYIKDFDHFTDHFEFVPASVNDELFMKNLFLLKGQRWQQLRATMSPTFTGSKLRIMFELMSTCGHNLVDYLKNKYEQQLNDNRPLEIEFKDVSTRFTCNVVATTAFGLKIDALKDPNNEFYKMGRKATKIPNYRFAFIGFLPRLANLLGITLIPSNVYVFFKNIILQTIRMRKEQNIIRPDIIQLLLEAQKEQNDKEPITDIDIVSQAFSFFFAGFDTVSTGMSFAAYELAVNPECQTKLQNEIDLTLTKCNGQLNYDELAKMKYLDMVVSETLRKWPPNVATDRICTKEYELNVDGEKHLIEKGIPMIVALLAMHRDSKYYPEPDKFIPERFNDENKINIHPMTYLPFGAGPRQCIANRFARIEIKLFLFYLLGNFDLHVIKKTSIPMVLKKTVGNLDAKNGFWIGIKPRKEKN